MKKLLFIILFFSILYSQEFEYGLYHPVINGVAKIDITNSISLNSGVNQNYVICEGTTVNVDGLIQKGIVYENSYINSLCDFDAGAHNVDTCWKIGEGPSGGGYWPKSTPRTGTAVIITQDTKNTIASGLQGFISYSTTQTLYENIIKNNGYANLSKFYLYGPGNNINAEGRVGVGCLGTYSYQIKEGSSTLSTLSGDLSNNIQANYKFDEEGQYSIAYSTNVNDCLVVYEEKYKDTSGNTKKFIHRFVNEEKRTPQTATRTLNVEVVNSDGPDFTAPSGNVNCGLVYSGGIFTLPPMLIQGESVIIPATMRITNIYDVDIEVEKVNANFYDVTAFPIINQPPTSDIKINSITTDPLIVSGIFAIPVEVKAGETKTIRVYINATVTTNEPDENYNLRMNFDYSYPTPSHGCYLGNDGTGACQGPLNVDVIDNPDDISVYALNSNVSVIPNLINIPFVEAGRNTVNITGRVNFTNTTTSGTSPVVTTTTSYPTGVKVKLVSLVLDSDGTDCLASSVPVNLTHNGNYLFKDVKLKEECLKYEMNNFLVAGIDVEYTIGGITYTNSSTGRGRIDTTIPPVMCEITYSMIGSNYNPEGGEEEYNVTVSIWNGLELQKIEYSCGLEDKNEGNLNSGKTDEYNFVCKYDFKDEEETEYIVTARVYDIDTRTTYIVDCPARNIGLCLPYV